MQFVPGTWTLLNRDGNGDGTANPNNIWDATLSAGTYLCENNRDLSQPSAQAAAVFAYNPSVDYVTTVLAWARAYATGAEVDLSTPIEGIGNLPGAFAEPPGFSVPIQEPYTSGIDPGFPLPMGSGPVGTAGSGFGGGAPTGGGATPPAPRTNPTPPHGQQPPPHSQNPKPPDPKAQNPNPPPAKPVAPQPLVVTLDQVSAVRTPAEPTTEKPVTSVKVTAKITASRAADAQVILTLSGAKKVQVSRVEQAHLAKGTTTVEFEVIDGGFFGDVGVNGPFTAKLTQQETDAKGKPKADTKASTVGTKNVGSDWKATEFEGYRATPTIEDISGRVDEFAQAKVISADAKRGLDADLAGNNLAKFQADLTRFADDGKVGAEAETRLDRLAQRRLDPEATPPSP